MRTQSAILKSITFSVASIAGGKSLVGTVTLSKAAPAGGAIVTLALNDTTDPCVIPSQVLVPAYATSATFPIQTSPIAAKSFTETIWGNDGVTVNGSFTVLGGSTPTPAPTPTPTPVPVPAPAPTPAPASGSGSLAAGLGAPSFFDGFDYVSPSSSAFLAIWAPQLYAAANYAGAGSENTMLAANITFPINEATGEPCLCLELNQPSAGESNGAEILSAASLFAKCGLGGYGTYEFCARFGSASPTPTGAGAAVSGGVSSTFLISHSNSGGSGYVELDVPEVEGQHPTWAEYDTWFNSNSGGNTKPSGPGFTTQDGSDSYLPVPNLTSGFNYFGIVWEAGKISYYLNGVLQGTNTSNIPVPGTGNNIPGIDINHYGTNSADWGGIATPGTPRYFYVESVKFWAA